MRTRPQERGPQLPGVFVVHATCSDHIRPVDQAVMDLLRQEQALSVPELSTRLEVTATAVRQRLDRLAEIGMVERSKSPKEAHGRGRPQFRYHLTALGLRYSAASYADLATALWAEVMDIPNPQMRGRLLRRVAKRMGQSLKDAIPPSASLGERLNAMASEFGRRKVAASVKHVGPLPILEVHACPYPELTNEKESRQLCELEQEMLSEAVGHSLQLDCCRLDGHNHCQFRPIPQAT